MTAAAATLFRVPVIGWMLKDALFGRPDAKYYFAANLAVVFVYLVATYGYPFLIVYALTSTAVAMVLLVVLTAGDAFDTTRAKPRAAAGEAQGGRRPHG